MSKILKSWVLTDLESNTFLDSFQVGSGDCDVNGKSPWSVQRTVLKGGMSNGVDVIEMTVGDFSISIIPTRGMGIWKGRWKDLALGWESPVGFPVHPHFIESTERGGLGWLRGFNECVVRCGLESNGAPCRDTVMNNMGNPVEIDLGLHGRIANIPASRVELRIVEGETGDIDLCLLGEVIETGLFLPSFCLKTELSIPLNSEANSFHLVDVVKNLRDIEAEMQILYHCNFGPPFLNRGSRLVLPIANAAPRDSRAAEGMERFLDFDGPTPGYVEQCYFTEPVSDDDGNTLALLLNEDRGVGVVLGFNVNQLPCFTLWKNTAGVGDGYVTGLEPATNFPNPRPFERKSGRVVNLAPGQSYRIDLSFEFTDSKKRLEELKESVEKIQGDRKPNFHGSPIGIFSEI